MALDLATLPEAVSLPDGCVVVEVRDVAEWAGWCEVFAAGYGFSAAILAPLLRALSAPVRPGHAAAPLPRAAARRSGGDCGEGAVCSGSTRKYVSPA